MRTYRERHAAEKAEIEKEKERRLKAVSLSNALVSALGRFGVLMPVVPIPTQQMVNAGRSRAIQLFGASAVSEIGQGKLGGYVDDIYRTMVLAASGASRGNS